jgi:hypothetical protein
MNRDPTGSISRNRRNLMLAFASCALCKLSIAGAQEGGVSGCMAVGDGIDLASLAPLSPSNSPREKWMIDELERLKREEQLAASVSWIDGVNAYAFDSNRIAFGRGLAQVIESGIPDLTADQRDTIFRFVIGHEFTHILQARQSGNGVPSNVRGRELQADFGGGVWLGLCLSSPDGELDFFQSARAIRFAYSIGGSDWQDPGAHGTSDERWSACFFGAFTARISQAAKVEGRGLSQRVSTLVFSPNGMGLVVAAEMTASIGRDWYQFFGSLLKAIEVGHRPPTSPDGSAPTQVSGDYAYFYVFDATQTSEPSHHFDYSYYEHAFERLCPDWGEVDFSGRPLRSKYQALQEIVDQEKMRIVSAVNDPGAQFLFAHTYQDIDATNVRMTCGFLRNGQTKWVVLVASSASPASDIQKHAFMDGRDAHEKAVEQEIAAEQEIEDEPFAFANEWLTFLEAIRDRATKAKSFATLREEIVKIKLPSGVEVAPNSAEREMWLILYDSVDPHDDGKRAEYISEHVSDTFSDDEWEESLPEHLGVNSEDVALAKAAAAELTKREDRNDLGLDEHQIYILKGANKGHGSKIETVSLQNQTPDVDHYHKAMLMRLSWVFNSATTAETT